MGNNAAGATSKEDFEPFYKWHTEKEKLILEISLKGFKKEQLKAHTNNKGKLVVYGERPVDGSKWSCFKREFDLPKNCNVNEIRARFSHGVLSILMPTGDTEGAKEACRLGREQQKLDLKEKDSIWGVKINKKRALKVAVIVVVAVMLVALGTQIAKLVHRDPHDRCCNCN